MPQDHLVNHPFPYFGLLVTRDVAAIKKKLEERYKITEKFANSTTLGHKYREFSDCAVLLANPTQKPGEFVPDPNKINKIVEACLQLVEAQLLGFVWHDNSVHVGTPDRVTQWGKDTWQVDPALSRPFIDDLLRRKGIQTSTSAPKRQPKPVTNLRCTLLSGAIELRWDLPPADCDSIIVTRSEFGTPQLSDKLKELHGVSWTDTNVTPGRTYTYGIFSVADGNPGAMECVRVTTRSTVEPFQAFAEGKKIVLTWEIPENTLKMIVLRGSAPLTRIVDDSGRLVIPPGASQIAEIGPLDRYEDTRAVLGRTYHYAVAARHGVDCYSPSESRCVTLSSAPPPPQGVKVEAAPGAIHLSWQPPPGVDQPRYRVERSETPSLGSPDSNAARLRPMGTTYDDRNLEPGTAYWYYLWTVDLDGLESDQPAVAGPVLAWAEVSDLRCQVAEQQVQLTWSQPARTRRVEIRRGVGQVPPAPTQPGIVIPGAVLVPVLQPGRLIDMNLTNDRTYGYRICCVFMGPDGREMATRGEAVLATPAVPPPNVGNITLATTARGLAIRWQNPEQAQVVVTRTSVVPPLTSNQCVPLTDLDTLGDRVVGVQPTEVIDTDPAPDRPFYLVFTVNRTQARLCGVGQWMELPIASAQEKDDHLEVRWQWPPNCQAVMFRPMKPGLQDPAKIKGKRIDRQASHRGGAVRIPLDRLGNGEQRFHIQCLPLEDDGTKLPGPGVMVKHKVNKTVQVVWRLEKSRKNFWSSWKTEIVVEPDASLEGVERLVLMGKVNRVPEKLSDGFLVLEWAPEAGEHRRELPGDLASEGTTFVRLFAEPAEGVTMVDPSRSESSL